MNPVLVTAVYFDSTQKVWRVLSDGVTREFATLRGVIEHIARKPQQAQTGIRQLN